MFYLTDLLIQMKQVNRHVIGTRSPPLCRPPPAEKSGRVQTLLEAMAAAIDPSLSSRTRNRTRDDLVFSSLTSLDEAPSQSGVFCGVFRAWWVCGWGGCIFVCAFV